MRLHMPVAVIAPAFYCLILVLRGGPGRLEGLLLSALNVAYVAAAVSGVLGLTG